MAGLASMMRRDWMLQKESELRCEVIATGNLVVRLTNGSAEIFGVELALNKEYNFKDQNLAIYTWYGCSLETYEANGVTMYVEETTPMTAYVNTHIQLEARRDFAIANDDYGPRVLIVGPTDHGKSTLAQILTAYAARLDRCPIFVDLDVGQSFCSISGAISAIPVEKINLSAEEGLTNINPLIYFYGHNTPQKDIDHYKKLITILSNRIQQRLDNDNDTKSSGIIVNTCGWVEGPGFDLIVQVIQQMKIDVVLVMGQDRLYSTLATAIDQLHAAHPSQYQKAAIVKLPLSGGVVRRDEAVRRRLRNVKIRDYFYGRLNTFSPERKEGLQLSSFTFLQVKRTELTEDMRSIGSTYQESSRLVRIEPRDLNSCIAAVLHSGMIESLAAEEELGHYKRGSNTSMGDVNQQFLEANVAGFVTILEVLPDKDRITILSPSPGKLPSRYLLVGSVKWSEMR